MVTAADPAGEQNPLRVGLSAGGATVPCAFVIFGVTGDLSQRKLLPALYNLAVRGLLPAHLAIVGHGRRALSDDEFQSFAREAVERFSRTSVDAGVWAAFAKLLHYSRGGFDQAGLTELGSVLEQVDRDRRTARNRVFYLSTPSSFFPQIVSGMRETGLNRPGGFVRVVIEKPFGHDLASSRELAAEVHRAFDEPEIYRIDHYLGKETVQNIFAFRFANTIFEPVWNNTHVDHVQLTVAESIGVEHRAAFYEETGVVRDIVQNHLLQVLALVAMEPPAFFSADPVRDEKTKLLSAMRPMELRHAVRGQYGAGFVAGSHAPGYAEEEDVPAGTTTATFMAARLLIDNWRWAGTPFYIRTGKRLAKRVTEVAVQFKQPPHLPFPVEAVEHLEPDSLVLRIQPDEGISLRFGAKAPSPTLMLRSVNMDFLYGSSFLADVPEAYETLILDSIRGDGTLFTRQDGVERAWEIVDPLIESWRKGAPQLYTAGSWGPEQADQLLATDGRRWRRP